MKALISSLCLIGLATPPFASGQVAPTNIPPELSQLRTVSETQIQTVIAPAQSAYLAALESLKQQFTRSGKTAEAISVDNEIKKLKREAPAKALTVDPRELLSRRADYHRTTSRLRVPPLTAYLQGLGSLKQQFQRAGKLEEVTAVDSEIKTATENLKAAQAAVSLTAVAPNQIQIESAIYGDAKTKQIQDATAAVRAALDAGAATLTLSGKQLGTGDPAPGIKKSTTITYTVNGKRKQKTFPENTVLDLKKELR